MSESRRPIRVLHLRDSPWVDGPGRTILETAAHIDRERVDYHIGALVADPARSHPLVDAARRRSLPVHAIVDYGDSLLTLVDRVVALIDQLGINILHTSEFRSNVVGLLCRRRRPVKLVSTAHGWIANNLRGKAYMLTDHVLLRLFDRVILVSHAMRRRLPRWWVPDDRVSILHNALALDSYGQGVLDAVRRAPSVCETVRLLNVGRLSAEKDQQLLLRAVAALSAEHPGLRLTIAGVGPLEGDLRRLAAELGLTDRVDFVGFVAEMPTLYAASDLVVQSSYTEGLPNVILEAGYLGVPIVATDVGGTREVIEHGASGWLVEPCSLAALVAGIRHFLCHRPDFLAMVQAARMRIETDFSFPVRTEAQMRLYEELGGESK